MCKRLEMKTSQTAIRVLEQTNRLKIKQMPCSSGDRWGALPVIFLGFAPALPSFSL